MTAERNGAEPAAMEVFTLPEAAAYLRVPEAAIVELAERDGIPARRIGGEWRFLKSAVVEWLQSGTRQPAPGTKEAVLQHFGVFKDEDVNEFLETIRKIRKSAG